MATVLQETLDNGQIRTTTSNGAYAESDANRVVQIGPFRKVNETTSQSATAMTLGGVDSDAMGTVRLARSGKILGAYVNQSAALTAGNITIQPKKNATAAGPTTVLNATSGQKVYTPLPAPVAFVGLIDATTAVPADDLGVDISSDGSVAPTTTDEAVWLVVQFNP